MLFIIIGAAVLVVAVVAVLIGTKVFGLLGDKPASGPSTPVAEGEPATSIPYSIFESDGTEHTGV
ncbi:MAG: hypothetical protein FWF91_05840, partial [Coriobacteriia bacterium]|nr:hypothetical protein [Coriobacteriia bacterium]